MARLRRGGIAIIACAIAFGVAHRAEAQARVGSTERPRADDRSGRDAPVPAGGPTATRLIVSGAPRSYQVMRVQVPADFPATAMVHYRARSLGTVGLISRAEGDVAPGEARGISLVLGIPARARVGRVPAAEVTFSTESGLTATVVVDMEVTLVRSMNLQVMRPTTGARPGQTVRIPYQLFNRGNAPDTVAISLFMPGMWSAMQGGDTTRLVLDPGEMVQRELVTRVPKAMSSGSFTIRISAKADSTSLASDLATVDVIGPTPSVHSDGLTLSTALGVATGATGGKTAVIQYSLGGPIYGSLGMQLDISTATELNAKNRYRLSSLGQLPQPPNFALYGAKWRTNFGAVGFSYSEVMGMNVGGRGGSLAYEGTRYAAQALVSKVAAGGPDSASPLNLALRLGMRVRGDWISATALQMHEGSGLGRELKTIGASFLDPTVWGGQFTSEIAFRQYADGNGVGVLGDYTRIQGPDSRVQLRAAYAPGGASAFALARTNLTGTVTRGLGEHVLLNGQGWLTEDATHGSRNMNFGAAVAPQFRLTKDRAFSLDLGTRHQEFGTNGTNLGLTEERLNGAFRWAGLGLTYAVGGGGALVSRKVALDTLLDVKHSYLRTTTSADVTKGTVRFGSWTLAGSFTNDQSNLTTLPREARIGLGLSQFPLYFYGGFNLKLTGLVEHVSWFGSRPSAIAFRGDVTADLPLGFEVGWSFDRRPFEGIEGAGSWATSLRIGRRGSFAIPTPLRRGNRAGTVYQDLNNNGIHDKNEPGVSGIMVLRGSERVSTDDEGRYKFVAPKSGTVSSSLRVDSRSIPPGWLERPVPIEAGKAEKVRDIGLVPMANVRVIIEVSREDLGAAGALDLSKVIVSARDSAGRLYIAAREPTGSQIFPALPPGTYKVEVDPSALGVPLSLKNEAPTFVVGQSREGQTIHVELATRKVRMFRGPSSGPATAPPAGVKP